MGNAWKSLFAPSKEGEPSFSTVLFSTPLDLGMGLLQTLNLMAGQNWRRSLWLRMIPCLESSKFLVWNNARSRFLFVGH